MYCCTPKVLYNHVGGLSLTKTSVQHPLGWCESGMMRQCHRTTAPVHSPHNSYRWRGERVIEPIKWMGIIRRPWLTKASGGNLARTPGLHPYSFKRSAMGFLMTTESQDLGLTSHPKDSAFWHYSHPKGALLDWDLVTVEAIWVKWTHCHVQEPVWDDLSFVTWCIILLEVDIRR